MVGGEGRTEARLSRIIWANWKLSSPQMLRGEESAPQLEVGGRVARSNAEGPGTFEFQNRKNFLHADVANLGVESGLQGAAGGEEGSFRRF